MKIKREKLRQDNFVHKLQFETDKTKYKNKIRKKEKKFESEVSSVGLINDKKKYI